MNIFEIFKSYDFKGNKLLNTKTETPTENEHIVPKQYVDSVNTYNTTKANNFGTSLKFPWLTNVYNKSLKTILDDLLFPIINPEYTNPEFFNVSIKIDDVDSFIFHDDNCTIKINYEITPSDRISGIVPKLIIKYSDNTETIFNGTTTSDTSGELNETFLFKNNITEIILRKEFQDASVVKQDNYGNNYIPQLFTLPYDLDFNILKLITNNYIISEPIFCKQITTENYLDIFNSPNTNNFLKTNLLYLNGNNVKYILLIPESIYLFSIEMGFVINNELQTLPWNLLNNNIPLISNNLLTYNGKNYYFTLVNFGSYLTNTSCKFQFKLN